MAKYHELVEKYADRIAEIKAARAEVLKAEKHLDEVCAQVPYDLKAAYHASLDAECAASKAAELVKELGWDIEAEYAFCQYTRAQRQGVEGFWRESGITGGRPT